MDQYWDLRTLYASQSTPMMTAAGRLHYQCFFFHCMILVALKQSLQNHLADFCLTSLYFNSLGEAELKYINSSNHL